jgi:hypothetical protein
LALIARPPQRGVPGEPDRTGGIVLVPSNRGEADYFAETSGNARETIEAGGGDDALGDALSGGVAAPELSSDLPGLPDGQSSRAGSGAGLPNAAGLANGPGPSRKLGGGKTQTSVFGVTGTGNRFVYVFDRSASMAGFQGRPLAAAKAELRASLADLDGLNQFQIIFYNDRATLLNPFHPLPPRVLFATDANRRSAEQFIERTVADGATRHMEALRMAIAMAPDVIFFLTDAADPQLTAAELARVRRLNERAGATIHAIEFGAGPFSGRRNFLVALAEQNRGQHTYVDVTQLSN